MPLKFLIADDSSTNRALLQMTITRAGHQVDLARNGKEALMFFSENIYDIVILDINMPVMNGFQTAKEIKKKNTRNIPVYAMSGFVERHADAFMADVAVRKIYMKPIDKQTLFDILEDAGFDEMEHMSTTNDSLDLDKDVPKKLYRVYIAELRSRSQSCIDKQTENNYPGLVREAHTLRSLASLLKTSDIADIAESLEKAAALKDKEKIKEYVSSLSTQCHALANDLEKKIAQN